MKRPARPRALSPIRRRTNATERKGVNYVRDIVEDANCVFREIDRAGDYGYDAFVLIVDGEAVTPVEVALQIKAGRSFCRAADCRFSATPAQLGFWAGHGLTTLGVVYDPGDGCAWWIDLTQEAKGMSRGIGSQTVTIPKATWNRFDRAGFWEVLIPSLLGTAPRLDLTTALEWAAASDYDTHDLGARVLLARHRGAPETWEALFEQFRLRGAASSFNIIRGFIRMMGHSDEGYYGDEIPSSIRRAAQDRILNFGKLEFVAVLSFVDDYICFERGGVGWGLFAIIPPHPKGLALLADIAADTEIEGSVSENAALMLSIHRWWSLWQPSRPAPSSGFGGKAS